MSRANNPKWIILHNSGGIEGDPLFDTSNHTVEVIDSWHRQRGFPKSSLGHYAGYHFVVYKTGEIVRTRTPQEEGMHCTGMNTSSIGICLMGNFDRPRNWKNSYPTDDQIKCLKTLLDNMVNTYKIDPRRIVPHRKFAFWKTCFGENLPDNFGQTLFIEIIKNKIGLVNKAIMLLIKIKALLFKGQ